MILGLLSLDDSGSVMAVGEPRNWVNPRVLIYVHDRATSTWTQHGQTLVSREGESDLGDAVALNGNGNIVAVGSPNHSYLGIGDVGQVEIFQYDKNTTECIQVGGLLNGQAADDRFGMRASVSADGIVVGASAPHRAANARTDSGSVYVFTFN